MIRKNKFNPSSNGVWCLQEDGLKTIKWLRNTETCKRQLVRKRLCCSEANEQRHCCQDARKRKNIRWNEKLTATPPTKWSTCSWNWLVQRQYIFQKAKVDRVVLNKTKYIMYGLHIYANKNLDQSALPMVDFCVIKRRIQHWHSNCDVFSLRLNSTRTNNKPTKALPTNTSQKV